MHAAILPAGHIGAVMADAATSRSWMIPVAGLFVATFAVGTAELIIAGLLPNVADDEDRHQREEQRAARQARGAEREDRPGDGHPARVAGDQETRGGEVAPENGGN